jgi:hypothetical protein
MSHMRPFSSPPRETEVIEELYEISDALKKIGARLDRVWLHIPQPHLAQIEKLYDLDFGHHAASAYLDAWQATLDAAVEPPAGAQPCSVVMAGSPAQ